MPAPGQMAPHRDNAQLQYALEQSETIVDDLAQLVMRLAHALRKAEPDNELSDKALDYLKRNGLTGSILRKATGRVVADDAAPECTCAAKDMTFGRCCKLTPKQTREAM